MQELYLHTACAVSANLRRRHKRNQWRDVFPGSNNATSVLIESARRAARAGRLDEAARAWEQVRLSSPDHPEALYFFGQRALTAGDAAGATQWLSRATQAAPDQAVILLALASAHRALEDSTAELAALERALRVDPYCYPALLAKAALLEKQGARRNAARMFADALKIMPAEERLSPDLRALVQHARTAVKDNADALNAFLEHRLGAVRAAHDRVQTRRFDESKEALIGRKKIYVQQPVMLHVPRLPAIQFYEERQFPWLIDLEAETETIAAELAMLLSERAPGFRSYMNQPEGVPLNETSVLNKSPEWSAYFLWDDGKRIDDHCARCPRTAAVLESLPMALIPGQAPAAFFSTLAPGARIPPHTGVTNARLIVHLGLVVPEGCAFRVGNETRSWQRGKAWVFDDTIEHEARNDSAELRVILIFDIWNPYLSTAERDLICALLAAQREYYAHEPTQVT
jgi:aspartyl/asparaginyl beta-hydroxylase (cupin superfamily)